MTPLCPPELSNELPESLTEALIAPEFKIDAVIDEYVRAIDEDAAQAWGNASRHASVIANMVTMDRHKQTIEQLLKGRIRERIRVVHG